MSNNIRILNELDGSNKLGIIQISKRNIDIEGVLKKAAACTGDRRDNWNIPSDCPDEHWWWYLSDHNTFEETIGFLTVMLNDGRSSHTWRSLRRTMRELADFVKIPFSVSLKIYDSGLMKTCTVKYDIAQGEIYEDGEHIPFYKTYAEIPVEPVMGKASNISGFVRVK